MIEILTVTTIIGILSSLATLSVVTARRASQETVCVVNQCQIDSAKEMFATEQNKPGGYNVTPEEILPYLKGHAMPVCPAGGTYVLGPIGEDSSCESVDGGSPGESLLATPATPTSPVPAPTQRHRHQRRR